MRSPGAPAHRKKEETTMTSKRYAKILRGVGFSEFAIEMFIQMAQVMGMSYAEEFAAKAEALYNYYTFLHTPLPRELRRWEAERA